MKFKTLPTIMVCLIITLIGFSQFYKSESKLLPPPTSGETMIKNGEEEGDNQEKREAWLQLMHQADAQTDWRAIEYQTAYNRHIGRVAKRANAQSRGGGEELADGNLFGEWKERGSRNQAGSVLATDYDPVFDQIYAISAGGTLWRGARDGFDWEVVNQDLRFHDRFLKIIPAANGPRMLSIINDIPHYSDDFGESWTAATGINFTNENGESRNGVVLNNDDHSIFLLSKITFWDNAVLYRSVDQGETYQAVHHFSEYNFNKIKLYNPQGTQELYVAEAVDNVRSRFYRFDPNTAGLQLLDETESFSFLSERANLAGIQVDTVLRLWAYNSEKELYISEDSGSTWTLKGNLPKGPWQVGIFVSPSNPDLLLMGEVECYKSFDGGANWYMQNGWGEYYNNVESKMHADMMYFDEYETNGGEKFLLISNHGGLNVSYDEMETTPNIGLLGLNVAQYYDVRTDPNNSLYVYAGSQDQGFQRGVGFSNNVILSMEQVISGDYGHIVFTQNNNRLWLVYPGGWVSYYANPHTGYLTDSWEVESDNESVWIPPLMAHPDPTKNTIYMAGGNKDGGEGSYIIQLDYINNSGIQVTQLPFDFYAAAEGEVSALGHSPTNPNKLYAATTSSSFFYSHDQGQTWEQALNFVPNGHYLYGACIYGSKLDENTVYFAGSGYSNPAVYKSIDGGQNFVAMNTGMPQTLVFEITANADESLFFAATEAGPYVYVVTEERWYDMSGMGAPSQTYWSVEYLETDKIVRFGTYGRGIWDFQIEEEVAVKPVVADDSILKVYPNPASDMLRVELNEPSTGQMVFRITDMQGRMVKQVKRPSGNLHELNIADLAAGNYILQVLDDQKIITKSFVRS